MRFADKGYYIEEYVKCSNCGVLVYDEGLVVTAEEGRQTFCSAWCREWSQMRAAGEAHPVLPLPS